MTHPGCHFVFGDDDTDDYKDPQVSGVDMQKRQDVQLQVITPCPGFHISKVTVSQVWWSRKWLGKYVAIWLKESGVPFVFSKTPNLKLLLYISLLQSTLILKKLSDNEAVFIPIAFPQD